MTPKFLERNKKKGLLAALLLFLRERKALSMLLLVVVLASTLVVTPSYMLIDLPGGARLVAGVAWIAQKAGADTSTWGLGGRKSFRELIAVFRAAKTAGSTRSVGWGTLFGRAPEGGVPSSLDMVKGSRKDLESIVGPKASSVKGILTPEDPKVNRAADGVAISEEDMTGERESFLGGMMKGLFGSGGNEELSGGAFVSKGFFSGSAGGAGNSDNGAQAALDGTGKVNVPKTRNTSGTGSRVSTIHVKAVNARSLSGGRAARSLGSHLALTQLAEGKARGTLATEECVPPACPHEYSTAQTGAIYDGNTIDNVGILGGASDTPPSVPVDDMGGAGDATKMVECSNKVQACQKGKSPSLIRLGQLQTQLNGLYSQMGGACGDPCSCGGCNSLKDQIRGICGGELQTVLSRIEEPCDLPSYCETLGITDPSTAQAGASRDLCAMDMGSCGCDDICCDLSCITGS